MISPAEISGPLAALTAGLITSLHCAGMCGPLACAGCSSPCRKSPVVPALVYHGSRLASYALIGAVAGLAGSRMLPWLEGDTLRGMTWIFALFFLAVALGFDKRLRMAGVGRSFARIFGASEKAPVVQRAGVLGALTPLLPCAPLYLVFVAAALSGSGWNGFMILLAFGAGTVPLLFVVQNRLDWMQSRWSPKSVDFLRRGLAAVAVLLLVVRGMSPGGAACPLCH